MTYSIKLKRHRWVLKLEGSVVGVFPTLGAAVGLLPVHSGATA